MVKEVKMKEEEGKCCVCHRLTNEKYKFADDWDEDEEGNVVASTSYEDWCHEECFNHMINKYR
jgi:hypothetical protein